jgi:hypothetical protein
MCPSTQSVSDHICFAEVVVDFKVIILDKFQPSSLHEIKIQLCEDVITINLTMLVHDVMSPDLESINHDC